MPVPDTTDRLAVGCRERLGSTALARPSASRRSPSPLVAALAQAVIDAHANRAGRAAPEDGMFGHMRGDGRNEAPGSEAVSQRMYRPALTLITGGGRTTTEP